MDIFDFSNLDSFFRETPRELDQHDSSFICSLNMKKVDKSKFRKILTSIERPNIIFVIFDKKLLVYDINDSLTN